MADIISLLKEQIEQIEELKKLPEESPQYRIWEDTTVRILRENFNEEYVDMFNSIGIRSIISDESYEYFLDRLEQQKSLLEGFIKEKERFEKSQEVNVSTFSPLATYVFHPEVNRVSQKLFEDGHYPQAVEEAFKRVIKEVKSIVKEKTGEDLDGDKAMNRAFGSETQAPVIYFNSLQTLEERDEQRGIMFLFKGVVGIRNRKAHDNVSLNNPERATEYLALASLLLRLLNEYSN